MKGKYFKRLSKGYEVVSEALMHPDGEVQLPDGTIQFIAMCLDDNSLGIFSVETIDCLVDDKKHIGY